MISSRSHHSNALLGPDTAEKLVSTRVLIVGAGGIGSELVKNMVLGGFKDITLLDLDTIDLSNLNRQFLFRKKDVKQSKALVAARTVSGFNPQCTITPIHGNIMEPTFDTTWFGGFTIVLNALDNLAARRHVNKMCMASNVPLIESGTAGYLGQVQPILKDVTECFDCVPKPTPKSFPVCTIRSTPSAPIHCIVWAKSYLFTQLFGEEDDDVGELDDAAKAGENATEIENLRREATAFKAVRASMLSATGNEAASLVFQKVFQDDIARLLTMGDMWKFRKPPTPLNRATITQEALKSSEPTPAAGSDGVKERIHPASQPSATINDQRMLSLPETLALFDQSVKNLAVRLREGVALNFDKDDDDALDFVTATSNLRSTAYGIPTLSRWDVKEMAGNIIPAIATTNAIIAGLIVLQALHVIRSMPLSPEIAPIGGMTSRRTVFLQSGRPAVPLASSTVPPPNPQCSVCRETYIHVKCDTSRVTLGDLVGAILAAEAAITGKKREVSVFEGGRVLSDPDWDDNLSRTLADLNCTKSKFITLADEEELLGNISIAISDLPVTHPQESIPYILPSNFAPPPLRPPLPSSPSPPSSPVKPIPSPTKTRLGKRTNRDEDASISPKSPTKKRAKTLINSQEDNNDDVIMLEIATGASTSHEALALEEDGLVIVVK